MAFRTKRLRWRWGILALICAGLSAGCAQKYRVTLADGTQMISKGKPTIESDRSLTFRDEEGEQREIESRWWLQIEPVESRKKKQRVFGTDSFVNDFEFLPQQN